MSLKKVADYSMLLGCDPEFFFRNKGEVVGAETFIPKGGIKVDRGMGGGVSKFIIDGVQAELNPRPNTCRAALANEIRECFKALNKEMSAKKGFTVDFSRTVEISKDKLMELDENSRKFGCAPSKSIYRKMMGLKLNKIDPTEYRVRAAGGHIHIGHSGNNNLRRALVTDTKKTVLMLDILVGNTSVLIDRDEGNIERRKAYGKAGEYRLPPHGLEYRTLSNFWLTSAQLVSFSFGMARLAVQLMASPEHKEFYEAFVSAVNIRNVYKAINTNDYDLALENFKKIEPLLLEVTSDTGRVPISKVNIAEFYHFIDMIDKRGLTYWFPQDPMEHWVGLGDGGSYGFWDFLRMQVKADMNKQKKAKAA